MICEYTLELVVVFCAATAVEFPAALPFPGGDGTAATLSANDDVPFCTAPATVGGSVLDEPDNPVPNGGWNVGGEGADAVLEARVEVKERLDGVAVLVD